MMSNAAEAEQRNSSTLDTVESVADPAACNQGSAFIPKAESASGAPPDPARYGSDKSTVEIDDADVGQRSAECEQLGRTWNDLDFAPLDHARVACIPYTPEFRLAFGILLSARDVREVSKRALDLSTYTIRLNPSDVTAWGYRRHVVRNLFANADADAAEAMLQSELRHSKESIEDTPKSYQLWEYRRFLRELGGSNEEERVLVRDALATDTKNYHAWSHLAWLSSKSSDEEVEKDILYTEDLILLDVRNNSAWSHRWGIACRCGRVTASELDWAVRQMYKAPRNESVWNYIAALVHQGVGRESAAYGALDVIKSDPDNIPARKQVVLCGGIPLEDRIAHCRILAYETDTQRRRFWAWKADRLD
jgi:protein farnesyltransferase/geranylgeranyltransferase type-1 subunit alpha